MKIIEDKKANIPFVVFYDDLFRISIIAIYFDFNWIFKIFLFFFLYISRAIPILKNLIVLFRSCLYTIIFQYLMENDYFWIADKEYFLKERNNYFWIGLILFIGGSLLIFNSNNNTKLSLFVAICFIVLSLLIAFFK